MRKNSGLIKLYGTHAVLAALANKNRMHKELLITEKLYNRFKSMIDKTPAKVSITSTSNLDSILPNAVHQNILLYTSTVITRDTSILKKITKKDRSVIVALDQITDPQNVGAIIRSALAFDVDAILMPEHSSPDETAALTKAAAGAIEKLPIIKIKNLTNTLKSLKKDDYWIIGLDSNTNNYISNTSFDQKIVLVLGAEGKGLRPLTKETCDMTVKLPMSNKVESLNVSNAAAIAMYELFKPK